MKGPGMNLVGRAWIAVAAFALALPLLQLGTPAAASTVVSFDRTDYPATGATYLNAVATGDFDGMNGPDIAALDAGTDQVYLLLNNGDGTFEAAVPYAAGCDVGTTGSLVAGDYDWPQDGDLDAVVSCGDSYFEVLHGDGAGHLGAPAEYVVDPGGPHLDTIYFTKQGRIEGYDAVVYLDFRFNMPGIQLCFVRPLDFESGSHDTCTYDPDAPNNVFVSGGALAVADYDNLPEMREDNMEMFTFVYSEAGDPSPLGIWYYGSTITHNGWLIPLRSFGGGTADGLGPNGSIAVGDLDGDGNNDIVQVANDDPGLYAVYLGPGDDLPAYAATGTTLSYAFDMQVADFDGDGHPDMAEVAYSDDCFPDIFLGIQLGNGDGTFGSPQTFCTEGYQGHDTMAIADFNGDNRPDVVTLGQLTPFISVQLNTTAAAGPTITALSPTTLGQGGIRAFMLKGTNFQPGFTTAVSGTGVAVLSTTLFGPTKVGITLKAGANAPLGARDVTVTNPGGGSATCTGCLTATPRPKPTSTSPSSGPRGAAMNVEIFGSAFQPGARASFGSGITVNSTTFVTSGHLTANITISPGAATGSRAVMVVNPDKGQGTRPNVFTVT